MRFLSPRRRFVNLFDEYELKTITALATLTAAGADLLVTSFFDIIVDTFLMVQFTALITKGGVGGRTALWCYKYDGTGHFKYMDSIITSGSVILPRVELIDQPMNETWRVDHYFLLRASTAGTFKLALKGLSAGSNSQILANQGYMEIFKFL